LFNLYISIYSEICEDGHLLYIWPHSYGTSNIILIYKLITLFKLFTFLSWYLSPLIEFYIKIMAVFQFTYIGHTEIHTDFHTTRIKMSPLIWPLHVPAKHASCYYSFRILASPSLCNSVFILNLHFDVFISSYYLFYTTCFDLNGHRHVCNTVCIPSQSIYRYLTIQ
jgi:hypothetical protein